MAAAKMVRRTVGLVLTTALLLGRWAAGAHVLAWVGRERALWLPHILPPPPPPPQMEGRVRLSAITRENMLLAIFTRQRYRCTGTD